ncbi:Mu-like prophage I protein [Tropicibacter naphthalenivorans]|uniref:Mu-like prophage I protein n=1 Tax=Tropicibacter naphthalenivorans TaxID=441103 RepID=A0A0P1GGG6_9RHOB|nr:Mu-like prophage I protein [Tropicibacter naphthalenivorans]SMC89507.1 Mu-like prophage I protein [Tropicibacter naphthalenivorans]
MLAAFDAGGIDLPMDYEHQNDRPEAKLSGPVPAAGWINELAARADGIWGRVEWTERARALIAAREYRFLFPSMLAEKTTGKVLRIKGAALVHNPALHLTALASEETPMSYTPTFLCHLRAIMKLEESASEDDILATLERRLEAKPDPKDYVPVQAWEETSRHMAAELAAFKAERINAKVEKAMDEGYFLPAAKEWALDLCRSDEAQFDKFLETTLPPWAYLTQTLCDGSPPVSKRDAASHASEEVQLLSEQLGLTPDRFD